MPINLFFYPPKKKQMLLSMKKFITFLLLSLMAFLSCNKFDDSQIWDKLNDHENRILLLEELCKKLNADIINLQTVVTALETNDYIVNASPLATGDGYTLIFRSGKSIVIYNGKDGVDGYAPKIGVRKDADGMYYWTVDGEWMIVDGQKVRASAVDGANGNDGTNGIDGMTPQFKIEDDYWYISYDNGKTWEKLGKATGDSGLSGKDGDSFFKGVSIEDGFVIFVLNDDNDTIIKIPLQKDTLLEVDLAQPGTLRSFITSETARVTTKLKVTGNVSNEDMAYIQHFTSLIELDMSEAVFSDENSFFLNPYRNELVNRTISKVWLPKLQGEHNAYYSHCSNLEYIIVPSEETYDWGFDSEKNIDMSFCPMLSVIEYSEGVTTIQEDVRMFYSTGSYSSSHNLNSKYSTVILPSTTKTVKASFLRFDLRKVQNTWTYDMDDYVVICKAITPPKVQYLTDRVYNYNNCTLYVPSESVDAYKKHLIWGLFNILPIE